jgi:hypothetical protein
MGIILCVEVRSRRWDECELFSLHPMGKRSSILSYVYKARQNELGFAVFFSKAFWEGSPHAQCCKFGIHSGHRQVVNHTLLKFTAPDG